MLESHNMSFYNPQVSDWHEGLATVEDDQKDMSKVLLFVIGRGTRGGTACCEAAYRIGVGGQDIVLVIEPYPETVQTLKDSMDANLARSYLREIAEKRGVPVFDRPDERMVERIRRLAAAANR